MNDPAPLPEAEIERLVNTALAEDWGTHGDITSQAIIAPDTRATAILRAREAGVLAGLGFAEAAFRAGDQNVVLTPHKADGMHLSAGDNILTIEGLAAPLLARERVAVNFIGHLSGIATQTAHLVELVAHTHARIYDTRKTLPGLRAAQKYAVRMGGGDNHRFGLYDAILIKDNHIAVAGGIVAAIEAMRKNAGQKSTIEIEVDTLAQLEEALAAGADTVLLDNMPPDMLADGVVCAKGKAMTEASGGISAKTIVAIAETGVDMISVGTLTHSARFLDVGLDMAMG